MEGVRLGPYQVDRELGSGGMGKVYAATGPEGAVALKVVHPHLIETPGFFKRFLREAQLGQSIRHENVVRTLDCDQDFGGGKPQCFLVMEFVEGQTLAALLQELERVPEELCRHVAREICKGLAAVHEAGVVHRDLKPENVLITPEHDVKIMDLGVAQVADEALRLSKSGAFVGSVEYAAPEQFKGGDVDGRTDLHALGVLLYELSSGQHPYRGGGFHEVLTRVCDAEPRVLGDVNPQLSAFFEEVVHTLLVKDPRGRFASATQLLGVLEKGEDSEWWHDRSRRVQSETRRPIRRIRIPRETAVHGRDAELATLRGLFESAKAGNGQVVLIEGEAGIGKSRLVDELIGRLQADGQDLNFLFGSYPPGGAATAAGAFSAAFREQLGEDGARAYLSDTPLLVPAFDALLRGDLVPAGAQPLTIASLTSCFRSVLRGLAEERPTVVLIDDLHFAPDDARALFAALSTAIEGERVLLVGSTRPGAPDGWRAGVTRLDHATLLELSRLGPKDLVRLLTDALGSVHAAEELGGRIAAKSDGNPFFVFEIIRGLREGQFITQKEDGTWASTRLIGEIQIPSSVLDLVNARVAGLTEDERALLDVAACWGYEFDPTLIGEVLGLARIPTLRAFGQMERQHRIVRSFGRRYVFDHHQVQEALYGSMNEQLREDYHAALAEALERRTGALDQDPETLDGALCVDLCEQYLRGACGERALRYLEAARLHLLAGHAHGRAIALTDRALAVPCLITGAERAKVLSVFAQPNGPLDQLGQRERQLECALQAEQLAEEHGDLLQAGWAASALAWIYRHVSRHEDAREACARALERARAHNSEHLEAAAIGTLGLTLRASGKIDEAIACAHRQIELWQQLGQREFEAGGLVNLAGCLSASGRLDESLQVFQRALALAQEIGAARVETVVIGSIGGVYYQMGRSEEALAWHERQLARARDLGDVSGESGAWGGMGNVFQRLGRVADAEAAYERWRVLCRESGNRSGEANALGSLAFVLRRRGRVEEARRCLEAQIATERELGEPMGEAVGLHNLGLQDSSLGDVESAVRCLRACLEVCERIGQRHLATATHLALGNCLATEDKRTGGDGTPGRGDLVAARDLARDNGFTGYEALACCSLLALPGGDVAEAQDALARAVSVLADSDVRRCRQALWKATRDPAHLEEAKRRLDLSLDRLDDAAREKLLASSECREILDDWRAELGDDDEPSGAESATRVG